MDLVALSKLENSFEYRMNLIELKYGEDPRIAEVHDKQLDAYYRLFLNDYSHIVSEYEKIIKQKKDIKRWPYRNVDFIISKDSNTMRKIAVFGNIKENSCLLKKSKKQFDRKTFYVVKNNILKGEELRLV